MTQRFFPKIVTQIVAITSIAFLLFNLLLPFASQPRPAHAGGFIIPAAGVPVSKVPWSTRDVMDRILRILADRLRTLMVRQIQRLVLDFFNQIANICPPYLKYRGTDVCRKIVGDWAQFFSDAVASAEVGLANEISNSSLPSDWRAALIAALLPIDAQSINERFTAAGGLPSRENTWENFYAILDPQRNFLGQLLIAHDEKLKQSQVALEAAKEEGRAGRGVVGQKRCARWGGDPPECVIYDDGTPAATQEQILARVAVAGLDITLTAREFDQIVGAMIDDILFQIFGGSNLFSSSPSGSFNSDPCAGLSGEALRLCREAQGVFSSPAPTPTPTPTGGITFTANPTDIIEGQSSTLWWAAPSAPDCTASGGWTGTRANIGIQTVAPLVTTAYTLTCGGNSANVTVSVRPAAGAGG